MSKLNLSTRNLLLLTAGAGLLIVVALVLVLIVPTFQKMGALDAEIQTAQQESDAARLLLDQRTQIKSRAVATDASLLELLTGFPENPELPSLIIELQDIAYDSGVYLERVEPGKETIPSEDGAYQSVPVGVTIWGTWADTIEFLDRIQTLTRQARITSFESGPPLGVSEVADQNLKLPYYSIPTNIDFNVFVIPAAPVKSPGAAVPAPAQ